MEKQPGETVHIPIVPVNLFQSSNIEVPRENITGGSLKGTIQVRSFNRIPKNRQIVVVLNSELTLVERIIHDETTLSPAELANVCILECRLELVDINVEVRWPRHPGQSEAICETIHVIVSPDDQVSCIKKEVEKKYNVEIMDSVILFNAQDIDHKEENKTLSYHGISSNSHLKLIVVHFDSAYSNFIQSSGAPSYAESDSALSDVSSKDSRDTAQLETKRTTGQISSASTPAFTRIYDRRNSVQLQQSGQKREQGFRKKSASLTQLEIRRHVVVLPPITQSPHQKEVHLSPIDRGGHVNDEGNQDDNHLCKKQKRRRKHMSEGEKEMAQSSGHDHATHSRQESWDLATAPKMHSTIQCKPEHKTLMGALYHKVADKWEPIGIYLHIQYSTLRAIGMQHQDPHKCLTEMLEVWLNRAHPPSTWADIIEAVEFLGEEKLGQELKEKYCQ